MRLHAEGCRATLADWNVVERGRWRLRLNARVVPYDLATPLFTDYAQQAAHGGCRQARTPDTGRGDLRLPVGTILSKTFYYPRGEAGTSAQRRSRPRPRRGMAGLAPDAVRLVETRLLVMARRGLDRLALRWNEAQTEARLMRGGELLPLTLVGNDGSRQQVDYAVPDQNQCAGCHGTDLKSGGVPIGPKARHLNRSFVYEDRNARTSCALAGGRLPGRRTGWPPPADARWDDLKAPLEGARAPTSTSIAAIATARAARRGRRGCGSTPPPAIRCGWAAVKLPIAAGKGTGDHAYGIQPGDPDASILPHRMASTDPP